MMETTTDAVTGDARAGADFIGFGGRNEANDAFIPVDPANLGDTLCAAERAGIESRARTAAYICSLEPLSELLKDRMDGILVHI